MTQIYEISFQYQYNTYYDISFYQDAVICQIIPNLSFVEL